MASDAKMSEAQAVQTDLNVVTRRVLELEKELRNARAEERRLRARVAGFYGGSER